MRVSVNEWQGLRTIDVRHWYIPKGGGHWGPSRKGVSFEAGKADALLDALLLAKQHVGAQV
ncbi:transcriptional coactivator p15/PC4 family protein [Variovorax sp. LjRoot84]|uniref:transcriptional coactivator p15/PC4 family protein n=1 Tax=Variovorax sp. LjRoot84 TaxID=3342340 RepID=UPI003ECD1906